jgi:hypothetical protein
MSSIEDADWLLTTCLDSDDILAVDHVARLREALIPARRQVINFLDGVILSIVDAQPRLYIVRDNASPFASLMEPRPSLSGARNMSLSSASRQSCNRGNAGMDADRARQQRLEPHQGATREAQFVLRSLPVSRPDCSKG